MRSRVREVALHQRALAVGMVLSVAIHVALFAGLRFGNVDRGEKGAGAADRGLVTTVAEMRVFDIAPDDGLTAENPYAALPLGRVPSPIPALSSESFRVSAPIPREVSSARGAPSVKNRILPRFTDRRLWTPAARTFESTTPPHNAARARISALVDRSNDSIAAAAEDEQRRTDWTHIGPDGSRWGTTRGRLYLGRLVVPYCEGDYTTLDCGVGVPLGRVEEYESRLRAFTEIREQRGRAELDGILEDRVRAIRSRAAVRRDSVRGTGGGQVPWNDG